MGLLLSLPPYVARGIITAMDRRYRIRPGSGSGIVREASPQYAAAATADSVFQISMGERGRLVLPAEIRDRLGISQGDSIALIMESDGTVSLKTREVALNDLQGSFKHLAPSDHYASDDLIAERRRQARMEDGGDAPRVSRRAPSKSRKRR